MSRVKLALLGALAFSTSAAADHYTRKATTSITVKQTERSKPRAVEEPPAAPSLRATDVLDVERDKAPIRAGMAQVLQQIIDNTPDAMVDDKADAYFRLAELFAKQHRFYRLSSVELSMKGDAKRSQAAAASARDYLVKAVRAYRALTDDPAFQRWPKLDVALFYYGYTLQGGNYMKEARAVYDKLLKSYPASKYVPAAHLAFADYYFEQGQLADAEARYKQVLKFPKSPSYWYAMYKLGWIQFQLGKFLDALDMFSQIAVATRADKDHAVLHRAAKKDFVRTYAEIGKADKAYVSFRRIDAAGAIDMLDTLADTYLAQGKSDKAIFTLHELMRLQPKSKRVCAWQYDVATATQSLTGATYADKVAEIERLVKLWGAVHAAKSLPAAAARECHDNAAAMSGELARAYHAEAARTRNADTLAYAERLYRVYLDAFPDAADYGETYYYYADLQWARAEAEPTPRLQPERWARAADTFSALLATGKLDPRRTKDVAYAAALGNMRALQLDPRATTLALDDDDADYTRIPAPVPLPPREQKVIAALEQYLRFVTDPNDDERIGMTFILANTWRRYHHYDRAIPIFQELLAHHRTHPTAEFTANLLLDCYNRLQQYDKLTALVDELLADATFMRAFPELAARVRDLEYMTLRKRAEALEREARATKNLGKLVACGQAYLDVYNHDPEATANDEVLYNAGVCFQDGRSITAAISAFGALRKFYPSSKLAARALARVGKAYGDIAYYADSAATLEEYAKKYGGEQDAYDAMSDAVFYEKGLGNDAKAIANTRYFIKTFGAKRPQEAANASFSLTSVFEKQGDTDALAKHLRGYLRTFGAKGGADRLVIAHAKLGLALWTQSCPVELVDGACVRISRERAIKLGARRRGALAQQTQCGDASKIKLTVVARDERKVREAMHELAEAARAFEAVQGKTGGDQAGARYYYGQAKLAAADRDYEAYLGVAFPANLDFDPRSPAIAKQSLARFEAWVAKKQQLGAAASAQYERVLAIKDAASSITAAARLGQVSQNFSDALFTAEIPKDLRTGPFAEDKTEAFCSRLEDLARPLEERSLTAFGVCLAKSTELGWFSDWSKLCERELGQIKPEEFPTAAELRAQPDNVAALITVEPPVRTLD
jgi:outer membrane protein assembly factor BamD (BamD/ComL family)